MKGVQYEYNLVLISLKFNEHSSSDVSVILTIWKMNLKMYYKVHDIGIADTTGPRFYTLQ